MRRRLNRAPARARRGRCAGLLARHPRRHFDVLSPSPPPPRCSLSGLPVARRARAARRAHSVSVVEAVRVRCRSSAGRSIPALPINCIALADLTSAAVARGPRFGRRAIAVWMTTSPGSWRTGDRSAPVKTGERWHRGGHWLSAAKAREDQRARRGWRGNKALPPAPGEPGPIGHPAAPSSPAPLRRAHGLPSIFRSRDSGRSPHPPAPPRRIAPSSGGTSVIPVSAGAIRLRASGLAQSRLAKSGLAKEGARQCGHRLVGVHGSPSLAGHGGGH